MGLWEYINPFIQISRNDLNVFYIVPKRSAIPPWWSRNSWLLNPDFDVTFTIEFLGL